MTLPDFLIQDPSGEIRFAGHRIGLFHLIHYYNEGYSPEMLIGQYPTLPLALVHKVIAFYLENQEEVTAYLNACQEALDSQRSSNPRRIENAKLRARLNAMQHADKP